MEEKILIKSQNYNLKKFVKNVFIVAIIIGICLAIFSIINDMGYYVYDYENAKINFPDLCYLDCKHTDDISLGDNYIYNGEEYPDRDLACYYAVMDNHKSASSYAMCNVSIFKNLFGALALSIALLMIPTGIIYLWLSKISLTVTDKRIFGTAAFGKRVDLPINQVSAFGTSWLKGISIGSSSGRIIFKLIKNQNEVHEALGKLFVEREKKAEENRASNASVNTTATPVIDAADQLQKFKALLDGGVITQEEFDAKKKELLGL